MNKVLVTGGSGFVGSNIVDALLGRGVGVRALVRRNSDLSFLKNPEIELAFGDVTDTASLQQAVAGVQGIVHCAGLTKARSLDQYLDVNLGGTERLLKACLSLKTRPERIVCLSSLAAFGPSLNGSPLREDDAPYPVSDYGRSKLEGQRCAQSFMGSLSISVLIPPAVYGPRDKDIFVYFKLAKLGVAPFLGGSERLLSLLYVADLARAAVECLLRGEAGGRSYFVDDGEIQTWKRLAGVISEVMSRKLLPITVPAPAARCLAFIVEASSRIRRRAPLLGTQKMTELLQPAWICASDRIRAELGFQSQYPLRRGLETSYRWYLENHWL